ncbi:hypothetical protein BDV26DRAFT_253131 [Aspergillus bertholletiae]|uniref:Uncharacterized protein n=1 Tax=Aspergillus bertholletiae TaxID=1226010 RepID=A0A5N7BL73_9EURO|nr:hypothetical protein BDV26DRAFT_253131 [Aspergillus bertholletiae]
MTCKSLKQGPFQDMCLFRGGGSHAFHFFCCGDPLGQVHLQSVFLSAILLHSIHSFVHFLHSFVLNTV